MSGPKSESSGAIAQPSTREAGRKAQRSASSVREENERLRRRLGEVEAELESLKTRQAWLETTLEVQRHARQLLEAAASADYTETIIRIHDVVRAAVPRDAIVLVISKGDEDLVKLDGRRGWHFPQDETGAYAGYHPTDSAAAIEHLSQLVARGGQYLLVPNTAFWWLEHYRAFEEHLEQFHFQMRRDDRCALYRLQVQSKATFAPANGHSNAVASNEPVPEPASSERHNVVCFPIIEWNFRFQRPQQLMRQFAGAGHRVFYLSHEFRRSGDNYELRPLAENLYEVSLRGSRFRIRQGLLDQESRRALGESLAALKDSLLSGATIALVQSSFWWPIVDEAAAAFEWPVVYDCMDYHAGFAASNPLSIEQEQVLLSRADLVVASSAVLEVHARKHNHNVLLLRNACDYDHFARISPKARDRRPVIGYYGAIAEWFDSDLVADLAEHRPDWDFILIGATRGADLRRLPSLPNISMPGEKPYAEIPDWLGRFDVAILPFKRTSLTEATNPVKAYEIFASGLSLVSTPLPEMLALQPLVCLASNTFEFERGIESELLQSNSEMRSRRRAFARENTWRQRYDSLSLAIKSLFEAVREKPALDSLPFSPEFKFGTGI